jgi:amidase
MILGRAPTRTLKAMSTWIARIHPVRSGVRLAVKDAIDVAGLPTTVGCAAVADVATAAPADAACVATMRANGAVVVGKTNLHELCFGTAGTNPWFGDPINPLAPDLLPGGSSSGSAVAVANDEADVALGTDTGGSVRIPAACCGVVGLKTTWGRVPVDGVWPLAPSLDTVGPLARDVAGVVTGMTLLEPDFRPAAQPARVIGRVGPPDADVDRALAACGFDVIDVALPGFETVGDAFTAIILTEAWAADGHLFERADRIGEQVRQRLELARDYDRNLVPAARATQAAWQEELRAVFERCELLALPTLISDPPPVGADGVANALCFPWNVAGTPAISLPVGTRRPIPTSLQLVGPWGGEELLCATAAAVEGAARP